MNLNGMLRGSRHLFQSESEEVSFFFFFFFSFFFFSFSFFSGADSSSDESCQIYDGVTSTNQKGQ